MSLDPYQVYREFENRFTRSDYIYRRNDPWTSIFDCLRYTSLDLLNAYKRYSSIDRDNDLARAALSIARTFEHDWRVPTGDLAEAATIFGKLRLFEPVVDSIRTHLPGGDTLLVIGETAHSSVSIEDEMKVRFQLSELSAISVTEKAWDAVSGGRPWMNREARRRTDRLGCAEVGALALVQKTEDRDGVRLYFETDEDAVMAQMKL